ncbi:hypoxanthine phosphoribosyltransferase [Leptospira levettii]|uniref:hypoxanthine phosphoribosyltransferase n=1 Tax=Leptospira levettii TaxID=2023178 RepID=UPI000C2B394B|nr:hypoxanthine phosphoribosyltransferase [Leptospira levettii]PKA27158.1 hypoxanthine phosphoribosyltransferase [Leptospira sp. mixed culture ATI2-C-A1]TGL13885.1 hypoxanthine phosphoribosyltransferase [Leptospira levettii]TGM44863.1 hypoxanthine phosphoribosyltransferase [Leptospira levettii]TGM68940.1 hypoxanthine phosphoribosyltransferase [Leptospira levettii]TGM75769.1 hypoxanthine phosphoribosyltransferase [Leptospira levettii]
MKPLYSEERIHHRVEELAREISRDFLSKDLVVIGILNGGFIFTADLCRDILIPHEVDFMAASSYGDGTSSGDLKITKQLKKSVQNKSVLLVEDIVDTGKTLEYLLTEVQKQNPKDLKVAALFWKQKKANPHIIVDYPGFIIEDDFLVGYGLDYQGKYRNLPYVAKLEGTE